MASPVPSSHASLYAASHSLDRDVVRVEMDVDERVDERPLPSECDERGEHEMRWYG